LNGDELRQCGEPLKGSSKFPLQQQSEPPLFSKIDWSGK
jgi:hypothetical protein